MKNIKDVKTLLADVTYKNWVLNIVEDFDGFVMSVTVDSKTWGQLLDIKSDPMIPSLISEWYISKHSTDTEIIRTAHKAIMYVEMYIVEHCSDNFWHMNILSIQTLIYDFKYKDWKLHIEDRGADLMAQIIFDAPDNDDHTNIKLQSCRKFIIRGASDFSTVLNTILYAIRTAEEHEINEMFKYRGVQIYNPHVDLQALAYFIENNKFDRREENCDFCACGMAKTLTSQCIADDCPGNNQIV